MNETETIEVPHFDGFKCIGYGFPKKDQYFLRSNGLLYVSVGDHVVQRLTYEKIQPKRYVFEETGEHRPVAYEEVYLDSLGGIQTWISLCRSACDYKILRQVAE